MATISQVSGPLRLTEHPLQRCGAWAVTVLAGQEQVGDVSPEVLDAVAERIVADAVLAGCAAPGSGAYDWWKVLFALYPNAKPTHARRERDPAVLRTQVAELFAVDPVDGPVYGCTFCGQACRVLWAKATLPMFDSIRAVNTLPPGMAGWAVCRGCRVAMWALPYGAWLTAGSATVLTCDSPQVERDFVRRNVRRAGRIRQLGFGRLPAIAGPEAVTLEALRVHAGDAPAAATLWMFKNDNQEPWLRVSGTRSGVARFLQLTAADPYCAAGWRDLQRALTRRDKQGRVLAGGAREAARLLFDRDGEQADRLPRELWRRSEDVETISPRTLVRWRALCRLYVEVMYDMNADRLKAVADLLADWIAQEAHRGRLNQYRRAAGSGYELHKLLLTASARLLLDGRDQRVDSDVLGDLLADGSRGWRERTVLWFDVVKGLQDRKVPIAAGSDESDDAEQAEEIKFDADGELDQEGEESA
ncbi:hypothetical protein DP939_42140 [Spongiactinospora rosea]|uniref:CRISPR-associated protein Cst1 n=1 Tax=Spongiactinospora rosea TaxID=2248750 RepID=A0A366LKG0_9ACTN|nr:hypothetical protein DP939_42140 [Spongiactinospora rosea]